MIVVLIILLILFVIGIWVKTKMKINWKIFLTVILLSLIVLIIAKPQAIKNYLPETKIFNIDDLVKVGDLDYCVQSVQFSEGIIHGFMKRRSYSGIYLVAIITVKNLGNEPLNIDNNSFSLTDNEGKTYAISKEASFVSELGANLSIYGQCNPNIVKGGYIIFEVPEKKIYSIHLKDVGNFKSEKIVRLVEK